MKINNLKFGVYNNLQIRINKKMICFCGADNFQLTIREKLNMENQEILNSVLNEFNRFEAIEAIGIGGSSAAKTADTASDIDIYMFVNRDIPQEQREKIIKKYSTNYEVGGEYFGSGDEFYVDKMNKQLDVMYFNKKWFEDNFENIWIKHYPSNGYSTCFLHTLNIMKIVNDKHGWLTKLQNRLNTPYPQSLQKNIIKRNLMLLKDKPFASYYEQLAKALKRNDMNSINHRTAAFLASYFDIIFAKNELLHPGEKRLVEFAKSKCKILPKDFEKNVNNLAVGKLSEKLQTAANMIKNLREIL